MKISIIVAMTKDKVIGQGNKLPWHIPEDLQHFKAITMGKPMIMGRGTFDSMGRRPLPGRKTIILTRDRNFSDVGLHSSHPYCHPRAGGDPGYIVVDSIEKALLAAGDATEIMIVGGANIYKQFLPMAEKMYLSIIHKNYAGDIFFPEYDTTQWRVVAEEVKTDFTVQILEKII